MQNKFGCCLAIGSFVPEGEGKHKNESVVDQLSNGLAMLKTSNYDFAELTVQSLTQLVEKEFEQVVQLIKQSPIKVPVFNSFIPPQLKITGEAVFEDELTSYLELAMSRVKAVGGEQIIFGSGTARTIPKGFSSERGQKQIRRFLQLCGRYGSTYGITVAIEPLNRKESNVINTVQEAIVMAEELSLPHIKVLGDCYHMDLEGESFDVLTEAIKKGLLSHVHIADRKRRFPCEPVDEAGIDFLKLFSVLQNAGYKAAISAECSSSNFSEECTKSRQFIKNIAEKVGKGEAH